MRSAIEANGRLFGVAFLFSAAMSILALTTSFYMLEVYDRVLTSRSSATLVLLTVLATGAIAVFTAGASAWLMLGSRAIHCDSLAPLTVLATLAAFLISICFRQMGRFPDKRSRWILLVFLLIAAGTLFADFRYVRRYREFCDQLQQQMHQDR